MLVKLDRSLVDNRLLRNIWPRERSYFPAILEVAKAMGEGILIMITDTISMMLGEPLADVIADAILHGFTKRRNQCPRVVYQRRSKA